jgi:hypothetical protein
MKRYFIEEAKCGITNGGLIFLPLIRYTAMGYTNKSPITTLQR